MASWAFERAGLSVDGTGEARAWDSPGCDGDGMGVALRCGVAREEEKDEEEEEEEEEEEMSSPRPSFSPSEASCTPSKKKEWRPPSSLSPQGSEEKS